jgi:hypothetical protein
MLLVHHPKNKLSESRSFVYCGDSAAPSASWVKLLQALRPRRDPQHLNMMPGIASQNLGYHRAIVRRLTSADIHLCTMHEPVPTLRSLLFPAQRQRLVT